MEQEPVKCPHCEEETTFRTSERFKKTLPSELTIFHAAVICNKCNKLVGFVDTQTRIDIASLRIRIDELEKAK
jgi:hypothetical protein